VIVTKLKLVYLILLLLTAAPCFSYVPIIHTRAFVRGYDGILIFNDTYTSTSRSRFVTSLRQADGLCRGYLTYNFYGENHDEKISFNIRMRIKDRCMLKDGWLFLNVPAVVSYRVSQKNKRVIAGYNSRGYPIWRYVRTGRHISGRFNADVALLVADGSIMLVSDKFVVNDIMLKSFSVGH